MYLEDLYPLYSIESLCKVIRGSLSKSQNANEKPFINLISNYQKIFSNLLPNDVVDSIKKEYKITGSRKINTNNFYALLRDGKKNAGTLGNILYDFMNDENNIKKFRNHLLDIINNKINDYQINYIKNECIDKIFLGKKLIFHNECLYVTQKNFFNMIDDMEREAKWVEKIYDINDNFNKEGNKVSYFIDNDNDCDEEDLLPDPRLPEMFFGYSDISIKLTRNKKGIYVLTFNKSNKRESDLDCDISSVDTVYANRYKSINDNAEAIADIIMCSFCIGRIREYIDKLLPQINDNSDPGSVIRITSKPEKEYSEQELLDKIKSSYLKDGNFNETAKWINLLWKKNTNFWKHSSGLCLVNYFIVNTLYENTEQFSTIFSKTKIAEKRLEEYLLTECYKYCCRNFNIADNTAKIDNLWGQACFKLAYNIYCKRIVTKYKIGEILEMAAICNCPEGLICQLKGDILLDDDYYERMIRDSSISNHLQDYGNTELNRKVAACFEYLNINVNKEYHKLGIQQLNLILCLYPDYEITQCIFEGLENKNLIDDGLQVAESTADSKQDVKEIYNVLLKAENHEVISIQDKISNRNTKISNSVVDTNERFIIFGYNKKVASFLNSIQDIHGKVYLYITEAEKELYWKEKKEGIVVSTSFTIREILENLPVYCWDRESPDGYKFGNNKIHFVFLGDDNNSNIVSVAEIIEETYKKECDFNDIIAAMDIRQKCIFADSIDIVLDNDNEKDRMYLDSVFTKCKNFYLPIRYLSYNEELSHDLLYRIPLFKENQCQEKDRQDIVILGDNPAIYPLIKNILSVSMFGRGEVYKGDSSMLENFLSGKLSITVIDKNADSIQNCLKYKFSEIYMKQPYEKIEPLCYTFDVESYAFFEFFRNSVDNYTEENINRKKQKEIWQILRKANYFICALSDGRKNIDLSFRLRSEILKRDIHFTRKPVIAALCNEVAYSLHLNEFAVGNTKSSAEWYLDWDIDTFGELDRYYTYNNFYNSLAEKLALNIHMSYYGKNEAHAAKCSYYNSNYNYSSSIAAALYIPYRLYSSGILDNAVDLANFSFCGNKLREIINIIKKKPLDADTKESLAIQEHARWNVYMALQGYSPATKAQVGSWLSRGFINHQFHLARLHPYIASWSSLGERNYSKVNFGHNEFEVFVKTGENLNKIHNKLEEYAAKKISILIEYGFINNNYFSEDNDKLFIIGMMPKESENMFTKYLNNYSDTIKGLVDFEDKILDLYKFYDKKYNEIREILLMETDNGDEIKQGKELFESVRQIANLRINYRTVFKEKYSGLIESKNLFCNLASQDKETILSYYNILDDSKGEEGNAYTGLKELLHISYGGGFSLEVHNKAFLIQSFINAHANNKDGDYLKKIGEDLLSLMEICADAIDFESDGIQKWMLQYQQFNHLQLSKYSIKQIDRDMIDNTWEILKNTLEFYKETEIMQKTESLYELQR